MRAVKLVHGGRFFKREVSGIFFLKIDYGYMAENVKFSKWVAQNLEPPLRGVGRCSLC